MSLEAQVEDLKGQYDVPSQCTDARARKLDRRRRTDRREPAEINMKATIPPEEEEERGTGQGGGARVLCREGKSICKSIWIAICPFQATNSQKYSM